MKALVRILYTLSTIFLFFGYWGLYTDSGRNTFDEMAGMIPYFASLFGIFILIVAAILNIIIFTGKKK